MTSTLVTVEQAADQMSVHPKTVLRYIRDGRLQATRIGKSYRIVRADLDAFTGVASGNSSTLIATRTTCIVDLSNMSTMAAEQVATFLHSASISRNTKASQFRLDTVFDPLTKSQKVIVIGDPFDVAKLLEMLQLKLDSLT